MEQTATKAFKEGIIDRRSYLLLIKGFTGDDPDLAAGADEAMSLDDF
jgi:hypothetical protein